VKESGAGFVCLACGKPRARLPGTTVLGEPDGRASVVPAVLPGTPVIAPLETVGGAAFVAGALTATLTVALAFAGFGGVVLAVAAALAIAGVVGGAATVGAGRRQRRALIAKRTERLVLELAKRKGGVLTVTEVAEQLHLPLTEADAALTRMSDGTRITAEVDETIGALHFVFHELRPAVPKTRVEVGESENESESAGESENENESESASERRERARER